MNVFDLSAKLTLDTSEYTQGLSNAEKETEKSSSSIGSKIGKGLTTAAKVGAVALTAASGAVVALTKNAVDSYAEYEQLVGGVETLFKGSADTVQQYAANAYQTAGLSANEYMETVTSFSASLLQSLGGDTQAAAEYADMAITDMSDNANKMGTSMEAIQNAYQGFAKQNYTMLDNLKLGYGGTKEEMQRLIDDANKLRAAQGLNADLTIDSYADIVTAIHEVQTEIGITGTTAQEASSTIQGSVSAMKSAWKNLVTGLGDTNADIGSLVDNVVNSAATAFGNLMPVIEQAFTGIGTAVEKIAPVIAERLPSLVQMVLPSLISAASSLVQGLVAALPAIIQVLVDVGPQIVIDLAKAIVQNLPALLKAAGQLALGLLQALAQVVSMLIEMGGKWIDGLIDGIREKFANAKQAASDLINNVLENIRSAVGDMLAAGGEWISNLVQGIRDKITDTLTAARDLWQQTVGEFLSAAGDMLSAGVEWIVNLVSGILNKIADARQAAADLIANVLATIGGAIGDMLAAGKEWIANIIQGIRDKISETKQAARDLVDGVKGAILEKIESFKQAGRDLLAGLWSGINDKVEWLKSKVSGVVDRIKSWFTGKDGFDEHSPSKWAADVFRLVLEGGARGLSAALPGLMREVNDVTGNIKDAFDFSSATIGPDFGSYDFSPRAIDLSSGLQAGTVINNFTTNVYAAQGQSEEEIARKVERRIAQNILSREAVWA